MKLTPISLVLSVFAFRLAIAEQQPVIDIVSGGNHNCAIFADSSVKCWGSNQNGQLGLGHTATYGNAPDQMGQELPSLRLGTGVKVWTLAAGANHTCALFVDGRIKCWGENQDGQLGLGDTRSRGDTPGSMGDRLPFIDLGEGRTAVQIATGARHTCALLDNGALKCWGYNGHGQLGQGNAFNYGSVSDTMGDVLDPVKLGKGMKVIQVTAGALHTCALLDNRTTKCWGYAQYGTLGQGNQNQTGDSPVEMGDRLPPIDLGTNGSRVAELVAGGLHQCARFESGAVKCWGYNGNGQLGLGDTQNRGGSANQMGDKLPAIALGDIPILRMFAGSSNFSCAGFINNLVKCWGYNGNGELGLGDFANRGTGENQMGDDLPFINLGSLTAVQQISTGYNHACALFKNGTVKCWGSNAYGQLGLGDIQNRGGSANQMGNALPYLDL